jgi:hypothetical protein
MPVRPVISVRLTGKTSSTGIWAAGASRITRTSRLSVLRRFRSTGAAFADLERRPCDLDLIVNTAGTGPSFFIMTSVGHFNRMPIHINERRGGKSLALADMMVTGFLEIYVVNYRARR